MFIEWVAEDLLDLRLDAYRYTPRFVNALRRLADSGIDAVELDTLREESAPINYGILQPREFIPDGVPMVRAVDLGNPFVDRAAVVRVPFDVEAPYRRSRVQATDVLISIAGSLGVVGLCPEGWELANINQSVARIRLQSNTDAGYVAAFLMSATGQEILSREAVGSVQRHFNIEDLRTVLIPIPDKTVQVAIGTKLRQSMKLREKADTLCKEAQCAIDTLIDAPAIDNPLANKYWTPAADVMFRIDPRYYRPDFVTTLRTLKSAGAVATLGDIAPEMGNGPHGGVEYVSRDNGVPYIRAKDLHDFTVTSEDPVFISKEDHERHIRGELRPGDVLITVTGANIGAVALMPESFPIANLIQSLGKLRIKTHDDPGYVAVYLGSRIGQLLIMRESVNTAREGINFEYLANVPILLPDVGIQREIGDRIRESQKLRESSAQLLTQAVKDIERLMDGTFGVTAVISPGGPADQKLTDKQ